MEASLGAAAVNAYYNAPDRVEALEGIVGAGKQEESLESRTKHDAFEAYVEKAAGKKVAVIGHFPHIEEQLGPICDLSILETQSVHGGLSRQRLRIHIARTGFRVHYRHDPDQQDTAPDCSRSCGDRAHVVLVGPTVPIAPVLFDYGVCDLAGFYVTEQESDGRADTARRDDDDIQGRQNGQASQKIKTAWHNVLILA